MGTATVDQILAGSPFGNIKYDYSTTCINLVLHVDFEIEAVEMNEYEQVRQSTICIVICPICPFDRPHRIPKIKLDHVPSPYNRKGNLRATQQGVQ